MLRLSFLFTLLGLALTSAQAMVTFADLVESLAINNPLDPSGPYSRLDLARESEAATNKQINTELNVMYLYLGLWAHFSSEEVNQPKIAVWFKNESKEEQEHAEQLMGHLNLRGGRVQLQPLMVPEIDFSKSEKAHELQAMELSLAIERTNYANLQELNEVARKNKDALLSEFVVGTMLKYQVQSVHDIAGYVRELQTTGDSTFGQES